MKKIIKALPISLMLSMIAIPVLAAGIWMGITWNDPYGSSIVNDEGNLQVYASSCYSTSCWGAAHYNTPSDFRAADTPWVEAKFIDVGADNPGAQVWMEDETYSGCYEQNLGTCGAWTQFGAWERDGYKNYWIYWWDYDTGFYGWYDTGVMRKKGEHTLKLAMQSDGTVDYWLDGSLVLRTTDITPNYFGDIYLAAHSGVYPVKVTGGGQASAGSIDFSITVSAKRDRDGSSSGQMEYYRVGQSVPDLSVHGTVECTSVFSDGTIAVSAGPAKEQFDPGGLLGEGDWMVVEILEDGIGSGDRVRVRLMEESAAQAVCDSPSGTFPGVVYDGNFNIRYSDSVSSIEFTSYQTGMDYNP